MEEIKIKAFKMDGADLEEKKRATSEYYKYLQSCEAYTYHNDDKVLEQRKGGFYDGYQKCFETKVSELKVEIGDLKQTLEHKEEVIATYANNACDAIQENVILKKILKEVYSHSDLCCLCDTHGVILPECKLMDIDKCINHIIEIYKQEGMKK